MTSAADRRKMQAIGRSLADIETDEPADAASLRAAIDDANGDRRRRGIEPLRTDDPRPEEEFYRRARALGFRRPRG